MNTFFQVFAGPGIPFFKKMFLVIFPDYESATRKLVLPPGRDSHNSGSTRLAEATEKVLDVTDFKTRQSSCLFQLNNLIYVKN